MSKQSFTNRSITSGRTVLIAGSILFLGFTSLAQASRAADSTSTPNSNTPSRMQTTGTTMSSKQSVAPADRQFAMKAAQGGAAEVALGKLAEQNASSPSVKQFGRRMVTDHVRADKDLDRTATSLGLNLDWTPTSTDQSTISRLSRLHGTAFDKAYKSEMIRDHQKDVAEFQRTANSATTPTIRSFAQRTLPTLQMHLRMANSMTAGKSAFAHRMMGR